MTTTIPGTDHPVDNGVNVEALLGARYCSRWRSVLAPSPTR